VYVHVYVHVHVHVYVHVYVHVHVHVHVHVYGLCAARTDWTENKPARATRCALSISIRGLGQKCYGPTDGPTDGRDILSHRDARTPLKSHREI